MVSRRNVSYEHDEEADAIYVRISDQPYAYGEELDPERRIDYSADGKPIGVELLCFSTGINRRNLPISPEVAKLLLGNR